MILIGNDSNFDKWFLDLFLLQFFWIVDSYIYFKTKRISKIISGNFLLENSSEAKIRTKIIKLESANSAVNFDEIHF